MELRSLILWILTCAAMAGILAVGMGPMPTGQRDRLRPLGYLPALFCGGNIVLGWIDVGVTLWNRKNHPDPNAASMAPASAAFGLALRALIEIAFFAGLCYAGRLVNRRRPAGEAEEAAPTRQESPEEQTLQAEAARTDREAEQARQAREDYEAKKKQVLGL